MAEKKPLKRESRAKMAEAIKVLISDAGTKGVTAVQIAEGLGVTDREEQKAMMHEVRSVARAVVKEEGWSRVNREGRNVVYQAIPFEEATAQKAEEDKVKQEAKKKRTQRKKKEEEEEEGEEGEEEEEEGDWEEEEDEDDDDDDDDDEE